MFVCLLFNNRHICLKVFSKYWVKTLKLGEPLFGWNVLGRFSIAIVKEAQILVWWVFKRSVLIKVHQWYREIILDPNQRVFLSLLEEQEFET